MTSARVFIILIYFLTVVNLSARDPKSNWRFSASGNFIYNKNSGTHNPDLAILPIFSVDLGIIRHFGSEIFKSEPEISFHLAFSIMANKHQWPGLGSFYKNGIYFAYYYSIPVYTFTTKTNHLAFNWHPGVHMVHTYYKTAGVPRDYLPQDTTQARIAGGLGFEYNLKLKNNNFFRISVAQSIMQLFPKYMEGTYAPFSIQMGYAIRLGKQEQKTKPSP